MNFRRLPETGNGVGECPPVREIGKPCAVMIRIDLNQSRIGLVLLLLGSLAVTCGCEVHVAMGVGDEKSDPVTDLLSVRLKRNNDPSPDPAGNPSADEINEPDEVSAEVIQPAAAWRLRSEAESLDDVPAGDGDPIPIDLPTVLRLAGAQSWNIELASERVREARTAVDAAEVMWMPSLIGGMGYTHHTGQLQSASGTVLDVRRSALFVGGGARTGMSPLAGGGGGPLRLNVDLSLADALFQPLVARQRLDVALARESVTFNDTLRDAALAYLDLVEAQGSLANCRTDLDDAEALLRQTKAFVVAGKGSNADTTRIAADVERRRQRLAVSRSDVAVASARLARQLRLDPATTLFALEEQVVPVELLGESDTLAELVDGALASRPELEAGRAGVNAAGSARAAANWRPWLPHVLLGISAGGFAGGSGDEIGRMDGRTDFDALAVWELENLGLGTGAAREAAASRERQAELTLSRTRDGVVTEVTAAWHRLGASRRRLTISEERLKQAGESLRLHRLRIRSLVGLPLEAQQAVEAISQARQDRLEAIIGFNREQVGLLRAIGRPLGGGE